MLLFVPIITAHFSDTIVQYTFLLPIITASVCYV